MKGHFTFRRRILVALVPLALLLLAAPAHLQSECISDCLSSYSSCINSQESGSACQDQYSACVSGCLSHYSMILAPASQASNTPSSQRAPVEFSEALTAHGVRAASGLPIKSRLFSTESTMMGSPEMYFDRRVITAVDGNQLRRESVDPGCLRSFVETVNDRGNYYGSAVSLKNGSKVSTELPPDGNRVRTITWLAETNGLTLLLREFAQKSTKARWAGRTVDGFDEFHVETSKGEFTVSIDQSYLIRSIKTGDVVLQFSQYRSTGGLELPYVERVLVHGRLVREIYFSRIEVNPTFEEGYFESQAVPPEQCR